MLKFMHVADLHLDYQQYGIKEREEDAYGAFEAAIQWAKTEGFISAPETSHAIAAVIREAKQAKEEGKEKVILFNWSGHGLMDLTGYQAFLEGKLVDYPLPDEEMQKSIAVMDGLPKPSTAKSGKW